MLHRAYALARSNAEWAEASHLLAVYYSDSDPLLAEAYAVELDTCAPDSSMARACAAVLLANKGYDYKALAELGGLTGRREVLLRCRLLLRVGQADTALVALQSLSDLSVDELSLKARVLNALKRPAEAIAVAKEVLIRDPANLSAHTSIAEILPPPSPQRPQEDMMRGTFADASAAYQRGDFAQVLTDAQALLLLDSQDGLAHKLYVIAADALARKNAPSPAIIPVVGSPDKAKAAIAHLEEICARAKVHGRAAIPSDLFPDWGKLTAEQQALIAWSIFGYGKLLPKLIERGQKCLIAMAGESTADISGEPRGAPDAYGRNLYAGRGSSGYRKIVLGVEKIDEVRAGEYNTFTHEFAHAARDYLRESLKRMNDGATLSDGDLEAAVFAGEADNLFDELFRASSAGSGRRVFAALPGE